MTGRRELVFEWYRRVPFYCLSIVVTGLMLAVAFAVMTVSLNLQGYIHQSAMGAKLLHFPLISVYSQPGALFDNQGGVPALYVSYFPSLMVHVPAYLIALFIIVVIFLSSLFPPPTYITLSSCTPGGPYPSLLPFVPVVLHALVIMFLNACYRRIAEQLTALENHRTDAQYNNSLLLKR